MGCCTARDFRNDEVAEVDPYTGEELTAQPCLSAALLSVNNRLSDSASQYRHLFVRRWNPNYSNCVGRCEHQECDYRIFGSGSEQVTYSGSASLNVCVKGEGHTPPCLCATHCPQVVVDIQVYRPNIPDARRSELARRNLQIMGELERIPEAPPPWTLWHNRDRAASSTTASDAQVPELGSLAFGELGSQAFGEVNTDSTSP